MKYFIEALRKVPKSLHEKLSKRSMGSFLGMFLEANKELLGSFLFKSQYHLEGSIHGRFEEVFEQASRHIIKKLP